LYEKYWGINTLPFENVPDPQGGISHSQDLIHQQYLWFQMGGYSKDQSHIHATRIPLNRRVYKFFYFCKADLLPKN
jgi:hypothetical protein